jgi:hypothetical protein
MKEINLICEIPKDIWVMTNIQNLGDRYICLLTGWEIFETVLKLSECVFSWENLQLF